MKQFDNDHLHRTRGEHMEHVGFELSMLFTNCCIPQTGAIQHGNNWNVVDNFLCHIWGREGMEWRRGCLMCLRLFWVFLRLSIKSEPPAISYILVRAHLSTASDTSGIWSSSQGWYQSWDEISRAAIPSVPLLQCFCSLTRYPFTDDVWTKMRVLFFSNLTSPSLIMLSIFLLSELTFSMIAPSWKEDYFSPLKKIYLS